MTGIDNDALDGVSLNVTAPDPFEAAFEAHFASLARFAYLLTGSRHSAEDVVQDAFVHLARRMAHAEIRDPGAYLRRAVVNVSKNRARRLRRESRLLSLMETAADGLLDERDDRVDLWRAIGRLPLRQRACVVLRYYEDLTEDEVAHVLGCSRGTVKSQVSKALTKLRREVIPNEQA